MSKPPAALTREGRDKCWTARDAFFQCLNANKADRPPEYLKDGEGPCAMERKEYEKDCPRSWVRSGKTRITTE
jgi:cytochrome c oxidase assembly factor 6